MSRHRRVHRVFAGVRMLRDCLAIAALVPALTMAQGHVDRRTVTIESDESYVSLVAVLANPTAYDGRAIQFVGYLRLRFEDDTVYLSPSDLENKVSKNSIWLQGAELCSARAKNAAYVVIAGEFVADGGPRRLYSGTLRRITQCAPYPPLLKGD